MARGADTAVNVKESQSVVAQAASSSGLHVTVSTSYEFPELSTPLAVDCQLNIAEVISSVPIIDVSNKLPILPRRYFSTSRKSDTI